MTTIGYLLLGGTIVLAVLVVGVCLALGALASPAWDPDLDGFSDEENT